MLRRIGYLLLLGVLATAGWAAAPALSLDPYTPAAEDFQQPLPGVSRVAGRAAAVPLRGDGHGHRGQAPVTHRTAPIAAPRRFDLVGLAGELRGLELRARPAGGQWSDWVETADGNPVYFGGADEVQLRTRGWRPTGRLHYVNVSGASTRAGALVNGARKALNAAFLSAVSIVHPAADAAGPRPRMTSRAEWGANRADGGCRPRTEPSRGEVSAAVIHHTVTANSYTPEQAPGVVLGICRYHRNANGWNDIGYNALVDRFGRIYVGRAGGIRRPIIGAHAQGFNSQTTGIAVLGTHTTERIPPRAVRAFARFLAWKLPEHDVPIRGRTTLRSAGGSANRYPAGRQIRLPRILPHRRVNLTACPGNRGRKQIKQIRRRSFKRWRNHQPEPPEAIAEPARRSQSAR